MSAPDTAPDRAAGGENETCPECSARFSCAAVAGDDTCWCHSVPNPVPVPLNAEARCLCPACLARRIATAG